ncbi:ATP-binding protein [Marinicellulosiphila megalodicopiae]|uniref:ATP-binding protein n=1 Tax=Marinicellulosiphila megalodicopiae TaxID=2724896 RepID=UPI003BB21984
MIIGINWRGFDKQFAKYRSSADLSQIQSIEDLITDQYTKNQFIKINHEFWMQVQNSIQSIPAPSFEHDRLLKRTIINVDNTLYTFRSEFKKGKPLLREMKKSDNKKDINWHDVVINKLVIAQIGVITNKNLLSREDQKFINQQKESFIISIIASVIISIFIGFIGARIFSRPIERLSKATQTLAKGDYSIEPPVSGQDEIAQLGRDLHLLSQTLSSNMSAKNQWIADISHELRTPVAVIKAQIEAMIDGIRKPNEDNLNVLAKQIEDLSKLINDLHELSMSDLGALNYQFSVCNISDLLFGIVTEQPQIDLVVEQNIENHLMVFADQRRIEQLFRNLMQNSIKYTDTPGSILVEAKQDNQKVTIHWQDSGPGASDEQLEQLFNRLYRIEDSRNKLTGGSGLGLSICKNIVEAHQGSIHATHSKLGGINIIIELPLEHKHA